MNASSAASPTTSETERAGDLEQREVTPLALELAGAYRTMVAFYRNQLEMTADDADVRVRGADDTPDEARSDLERIRGRPPDQLSWFDLNRVVERNPDAMATLWSDVRAAARDELESGHRTAQALNWAGRPWDRARFLAIRDSFRADLDPDPGIETALVEIAAESFGDYMAWTESLHMQADTEADLERHDIRRHGKWKPQRLTSSEAMAQSARMADRAHTRLLQTLGALAACRWDRPSLLSPQSADSSRIIITASSEDDDRPLALGHLERM